VIDDSEESIDIDTESDWKEAESIYASTIRKS
jgi:CMP-N-acetylneuraminic acid synthetase